MSGVILGKVDQSLQLQIVQRKWKIWGYFFSCWIFSLLLCSIWRSSYLKGTMIAGGKLCYIKLNNRCLYLFCVIQVLLVTIVYDYDY